MAAKDEQKETKFEFTNDLTVEVTIPTPIEGHRYVRVPPGGKVSENDEGRLVIQNVTKKGNLSTTKTLVKTTAELNAEKAKKAAAEKAKAEEAAADNTEKDNA